MKIDHATQAAIADRAKEEQQKAQDQANAGADLSALDLGFAAIDGIADAVGATGRFAGECAAACICAIGDAL